VAGSLLQRRPDVGDRAAGALLGVALGVHLDASTETGAALAVLERSALAAARGASVPADPAVDGVGIAVAVMLPLAHLDDEVGLVCAARDLAAAHRLDDARAEELVSWCVAVRRAVRDGRRDPRLQGRSHDEPAASDLVSMVERAAGADAPTPSAAMAGGLAGGCFGASAVPFGWRRALDRHVPRLTGRLVRLGMLAVNGGAPVEESWPLAPMLAGVRLGQEPFLQPLAEDPGVVLGNRAALPDAVAEVDAVVSLCLVDPGEVPAHLEHHEVVLVDRADAAANPNLSLVLADTAEAISTLRDEGKRVLVHCLAGRSRTPTVVAAYLAARTGLTGPEAFARVAPQVPHPDPVNRAFQTALEQLASSATSAD
jgi:hypothetical protein